LDVAQNPGDMNVPGYGDLHRLSGELKNFWLVKMDKNFRIIFQFADREIGFCY
jgi:proteic killer suppression protein